MCAARSGASARNYLVIIEESDDPHADETSLDLTERQVHQALGFPPDLPCQFFDKLEFEAMFKDCHLLQLRQQALPSATTRPVQKHLYMMEI